MKVTVEAWLEHGDFQSVSGSAWNGCECWVSSGKPLPPRGLTSDVNKEVCERPWHRPREESVKSQCSRLTVGRVHGSAWRSESMQPVNETGMNDWRWTLAAFTGGFLGTKQRLWRGAEERMTSAKSDRISPLHNYLAQFTACWLGCFPILALNKWNRRNVQHPLLKPAVCFSKFIIIFAWVKAPFQEWERTGAVNLS